jgi:hypothetical protein
MSVLRHVEPLVKSELENAIKQEENKTQKEEIEFVRPESSSFLRDATNKGDSASMLLFLDTKRYSEFDVWP